jgi:hypothetical protein
MRENDREDNWWSENEDEENEQITLNRNIFSVTTT